MLLMAIRNRMVLYGSKVVILEEDTDVEVGIGVGVWELCKRGGSWQVGG